ncbi:hypothetical protein F8M41_015350 [Gigaspora margarita]|uniref:Uncharacterized protein n=1 Tax=Gigaspora margarita TaxID=4874 RepID=A0A8H4B3B2_GIGMA|nr:hypothetical protein F8M41_015350 [Gigaspora margarita]
MENIDDNIKKKQTIRSLSILNGDAQPLSPAYTPNINNSNWPNQLKNLKLRKENAQINLEWEEFYIRINHVKAIYEEISSIEDNKSRNKKLHDLIKASIPNFNNDQLCEFSRWKKFYKRIVLLIENSELKERNIPLEFCFKQFTGLGLTVNYICEVKEDEFNHFFGIFVKKCIERFERNN